ncbi:MAG TPA: hypothetical protein VGC63_09310 [Solirubrobacterales bacterium]
MIEVTEQKGMRKPALLAAGLAVELGQTLLERIAVEEARERVKGRAAPVGAIGLDQRAGEDHGAEDQGDGGDQRLTVSRGAGGVDGDGADQEDREQVSGA